MGWPKTCHYVPAKTGCLVTIGSQSSSLKLIIKRAIDKTTADLVFDNTYHPADALSRYYRRSLWALARHLNFADYETRFDQDTNFGNAIGRVVGDSILDQGYH